MNMLGASTPMKRALSITAVLVVTLLVAGWIAWIRVGIVVCDLDVDSSPFGQPHWILEVVPFLPVELPIRNPE